MKKEVVPQEANFIRNRMLTGEQRKRQLISCTAFGHTNMGRIFGNSLHYDKNSGAI